MTTPAAYTLTHIQNNTLPPRNTLISFLKLLRITIEEEEEEEADSAKTYSIQVGRIAGSVSSQRL